MKTEYTSRIDSWLAIVLVGAPLIVEVIGVFTATNSFGAGILKPGLFAGACRIGGRM